MIDFSIILIILVVSGVLSDACFRKFKKSGRDSYFFCYLIFGLFFMGGLFFVFIEMSDDYIGVAVAFLITTMILGVLTYKTWKVIKDNHK